MRRLFDILDDAVVVNEDIICELYSICDYLLLFFLSFDWIAVIA